MIERRRDRFEAEARRATRWRPGDDPTAVLEALGQALWLGVLGELGSVSPARKAALREVGRRLLLGLAPADAPDGRSADADADPAAVSAALRAVAHAGLQALGGPARAPGGASGLHVPEDTLIDMWRGECDGLTAGRHAAHLLGCARCQDLLEALRFGSSLQRAEPLAVAAAAPASVRAPSGGRTVATLAAPALEAVLFDDGRLAVYAEGHEPVRLVAEGLTTEATLGGYWLGRVAEGATKLDATVHAGGQSVRWQLVLGA